jgi:hypothetical protein
MYYINLLNIFKSKDYDLDNDWKHYEDPYPKRYSPDIYGLSDSQPQEGDGAPEPQPEFGTEPPVHTEVRLKLSYS